MILEESGFHKAKLYKDKSLVAFDRAQPYCRDCGLTTRNKMANKGGTKSFLSFSGFFLNYSGVKPVCCWKVNSGLSFLDTFVFVINNESIKSEVTIKSVRKHFQNLNFSPPFSVIRTDSAWFKFVWPYKEIRECDSFAWFSLRMNRTRVILSTTEQLYNNYKVLFVCSCFLRFKQFARFSVNPKLAFHIYLHSDLFWFYDTQYKGAVMKI